MTSKRELEIYLHIPFCVKKCFYCDFLSAPADEETRTAYLEALMREVRERAGDYRNYRVVSVFVGGGTPSAVSAKLMAKLLKTLREEFEIAPDAEITIEVNPNTADKEKLYCYRESGVNRLSIGLQSADDGELAAIGRVHTFAQFLETYQNARDCGFSNVNVDVMSALPGQTVEKYLHTLDAVLTLKVPPEHISSYSLILEEGTRLYEMVSQGKLCLPDEESDRRMYELTGRILKKAGYARYEISNYAKEGFECRHNCGYWTRREYLGLGVGAASLIGNHRFKNNDSLQEYLKDPLGQRIEEQELSVKEEMEEFMFLGLRLTKGVSADRFMQLFGRELEEIYGAVIARYTKAGLLRYKNEGKGERRLALTARGMDVCNTVMAEFLL